MSYWSVNWASSFSTGSTIHPVRTFTHTRRWCGLKPLVLNERCFESGIVIGWCQGCLTAVIPLFSQTLWPLRWRVTAAVEEQMLKGQYKVQGLRWDNKSLSLSLFLWLSLLLSFSLPPPPTLLPLSLSLTHTHCFSLWTLVFLSLLFRHTAHHLGHSTRSRSLVFYRNNIVLYLTFSDCDAFGKRIFVAVTD